MPDPENYPERVQFRSDHSGGDIAIRPRQFLASVAHDARDSLVEAVSQIVAEVNGTQFDELLPELIDEGTQVRGDWQRFELLEDLDVIRVVRGLRDRGIPAQPNHVYFVNSQPKHMAGQFDPNLFAPNLFAPNLFAPNLFAPNLFAPNLFAPNLFAPNLFAGAMGGCCCPRGLSDAEDRSVPKLGARPVEDPVGEWPDEVPEGEEMVQIHIIDVASPGLDPSAEHQTGELAKNPLVGGAMDENGDGWADPAMGHGDFVQSIIYLNSGLKSTLWHAADPLGDIDDECLVTALQDVDQHNGSDSAARKILNLSLSGYNEDDRPSIVLADQIKQMIKDGWVIVASAGNNASCRLAWPAALPDVIAVGAFGDCGPAWFSNYGPWVDASARGIDVVAEYPDVSVAPSLDVAEVEGIMLKTTDFGSDGWVSWSGTSFSAPLVTARIALQLHVVPNATTRMQAIDDAIETVIRDPDLPRLPYFGTLVT